MPTSHLKVNSSVTLSSIEVCVRGDSFGLICKGVILLAGTQTSFEFALPVVTKDLELHTKLFFDAVVKHIESEHTNGEER